MSQTSHEPQRVSASTDESIETLRAPLPAPSRRPSHTWQNWTYFGAAIMGLLGASWALLGLLSLVQGERPAFRVNRLLVVESATAWSVFSAFSASANGPTIRRSHISLNASREHVGAGCPAGPGYKSYSS